MSRKYPIYSDHPHMFFDYVFQWLAIFSCEFQAPQLIFMAIRLAVRHPIYIRNSRIYAESIAFDRVSYYNK